MFRAFRTVCRAGLFATIFWGGTALGETIEETGHHYIGLAVKALAIIVAMYYVFLLITNTEGKTK